jgi:NADPH:quinone reductase-like Zn-dependent oxidoreductase
MTTVENNQAAWIVQANANPLQVEAGPDQTKPLEDEVIIRVAAVAINPSESFVSEHQNTMMIQQ